MTSWLGTGKSITFFYSVFGNDLAALPSIRAVDGEGAGQIQLSQRLQAGRQL